MKAFKVTYRTSGYTTTMVVLAKSEDELEDAISKKDKRYVIGNRYSKVDHAEKIPLSNVLVSDLSINDLFFVLQASWSALKVRGN